MSTPIVEVSGLSRHFGKVAALERVDFSVVRGRVYGLVGANGAGKTTLLKHLLGLLRPQAGSVRVFGFDPVRHPVEVLKRVGYLSEHREMPEWMRIAELMRYLQAYHPAWDMKFAYELIDTFNLDPATKISSLSQGMRAQTGLIAAVAHRPELLILDEPSNGLDAIVRRDIIDAVIRAVADEGRSVIFSSHLLDEMERTCEHVTMILDGKVAFDADLDDIKSLYLHSTVHFHLPLTHPPQIEGVLTVSGGGRSWNMIHTGVPGQFAYHIANAGGEVAQSRLATLEEIFIARAGRIRPGKAA
jgi:ABC-2 type transport system ATP-binding protein